MACSSCERGYYKKGNSCVTDCGSDSLEKKGECISASDGCGAGYKDMGGWCNRVIYSPTEATQLITDDDNNSFTIIFKK